jgi:hypothetical protein
VSASCTRYVSKIIAMFDVKYVRLICYDRDKCLGYIV